MPFFSRLLFLAVLAASASVRSAPISSVETADGLNVHVHATERAAPPHVDALDSLYAGTRRNSRSEESDLSILRQPDSERLVHMHKRTGPAPQRSPPEGGTEPTEPESGSASGHKAAGPMPTRPKSSGPGGGKPKSHGLPPQKTGPESSGAEKPKTSGPGPSPGSGKPKSEGTGTGGDLKTIEEELGKVLRRAVVE